MKKTLSLILLLCVLALLALGCTGGDGRTAAPGAENEDSGGSEQPAGNKTVNIGANEIVVLDPYTGNGNVFTQCISQSYEGLVDLDADGNLIPRLATDWAYSEDGLEYTFNLRDDVTFHDGSPLTAADVVYSMNRFLAMGQGFSYFVSPYIENIEAIDEHAVKITLNQVYGPFLMCLLRFYIVSEDMITANYDSSSTTYGDNHDYGEGWLSYHDAGTGPYTLTEVSPQEKVSFAAYGDYWQGWEGNEPDALNFILVTEAATVRSMMTNGQLDFSDSWQSTESLTALDSIEGIDLASIDMGSILYLQMNTKSQPLDDVHVRKALAYLIDYDTLYAAIASAQPVKGLVSSVMPGYSASVTTYEYSLEKAQAELDQSKYTAEELAAMTVQLYWIDVVPDEQKVGLTIQAAAQQVGLNIELVQSSWLAFTDSVATPEGTPALSLSYNSGDYPEAASILVSRFHSSTCGTWTQTEWLQDPYVDEQLAKALATMDPDARMAIYADVQQYLSDIVPSAGVYSNVSTVAYNAGRIDWAYKARADAGESVICVPGDNMRAYDWFVIK